MKKCEKRRKPDVFRVGCRSVKEWIRNKNVKTGKFNRRKTIRISSGRMKELTQFSFRLLEESKMVKDPGQRKEFRDFLVCPDDLTFLVDAVGNIIFYPMGYDFGKDSFH